MRLVFISYFNSVPLRKGYSGLKYKCLFYRLYIFLLHFLLFVLKLWFLSVSSFAFYYLRWNFWFSSIVKLNGQQRLYDVNVKAIYGYRKVAAGHEHLEKLCCYLNMPEPMLSNNYQF